MKKEKKSAPSPYLLWTILGLALAVRAAHLYFSQGSPFYEPRILDPEYYHRWALKIASGDLAGEGVFYGLPLYPFFLGLGYKLFNQSLLAVKLAQIFLGLVTVFFICRIGQKLHSTSAGLLAGLGAAVYGPLFFHEQILIPESLAVPLYAAAFYQVCRFWDLPTVKRGMVLGVLCALAALTKAGILLFVVLLPVLFFVKRPRSAFPAKALSTSLAVFFLALSPVTVHNWVYGHDVVFLTSHGGFNFYIGNNPKAEGVFVAPEGTGSNVDTQILDSKNVAERGSGRALRPSEVSSYWSDKAWEYIRGNPLDALKLLGTKLVLFFDAREISDVEDSVFARNFNPILRLPWLDFSFTGPLVLMGVLVFSNAIKYRRLVYAWSLSYIAAVVLFFVNARYRLPLLSVFLPLAAIAILETAEIVRRRSWAKLGLCAAVLGLGLALTQARLVGTNWVKDYLNAGDVCQKKGEYDRAMGFYRKAIEVDPNAPKASLAMGVLLTRMERHKEAKTFYEKCLEQDPGNAQALNNLGLWHERRGELDRAEGLFLKAAEAKPDSSQAYNNLGMVYGKMGEHERALEAFKTSLRLNPSSPRAHTNIGLVYYRLGDRAQARRHWESALRLDPDFKEARTAVRLLDGASQNAF